MDFKNFDNYMYFPVMYEENIETYCPYWFITEYPDKSRVINQEKLDAILTKIEIEDSTFDRRINPQWELPEPFYEFKLDDNDLPPQCVIGGEQCLIKKVL
jgi:hypothetical protein